MISVNLIPEAVQLAQTRRRYLKAWAASLLVAATLLAIPLAVDFYQRSEAKKLRAQNDQLQTQLATARAELRAVTAGAGEMLTQLERARALRSKRAWSGIFALIGDCMTAGCWLTSIATDPATPARTNVRAPIARARSTTQEDDSTVTIESPRKLRITGYATDDAQPHQFVSNLKTTGVFADVALEHLHRETVLDGSYLRFAVVCEW